LSSEPRAVSRMRTDIPLDRAQRNLPTLDGRGGVRDHMQPPGCMIAGPGRHMQPKSCFSEGAWRNGVSLDERPLGADVPKPPAAGARGAD
jgi:hypothetical protein